MKVLEKHGAIVLMRCPLRLDAAYIAAMSRDYEEVFRTSGRFAALIDTSALSELPGPTERKLLAGWMNDPHVQSKQKVLNVGSSTVITGAAMRSVLTALYWLWTPPTPQHAARDLSDGLDWCIAQLAAAKEPLGLAEAELRKRVLAAQPVATRPAARP